MALDSTKKLLDRKVSCSYSALMLSTVIVRGGDATVVKKKKLVPVTAMVSEETKAELYSMAAEGHRETVSALIDKAIRDYLRAEKKAQPAHETHQLVGA